LLKFHYSVIIFCELEFFRDLSQVENYLILSLLKAKANLERKRCADCHENYDFDTTTALMLKSFL